MAGNLVPCPECGNNVSVKATACPKCGCPLKAKIVCKECDSILSSNAKVCPHCGCPVEENNTKKTNNYPPAEKGFGAAIKSFFKNYANFEDRTSVSGYWYYILFNFLIMLPVGFLLGVSVGLRAYILSVILYLACIIYALAILVPGIALCVRRLHDTNRSGWWYLISLVPYAGGIILFVFMCLPTVEENNNYGPQVG